RQLRSGITADHVITDPAGLPVDAAARAARTPGVDTAVGLLGTQVLVPVGSGEFAALQGARTPGFTGSGADLAKAPHLDVPDGTKAAPEVVAVYQRGLGLATVTMDRASLARHVTSGFDTTLLVRGGPAAPLAGLGRVTDASGHAAERNLDAKLGAWTNHTMAAVLGGFAAVAAVNTLVMTVLGRRRELGTLRLVGTTGRQVLAMLRWESLMVSALGVVLGSAIAAATLIPMVRG